MKLFKKMIIYSICLSPTETQNVMHINENIQKVMTVEVFIFRSRENLS